VAFDWEHIAGIKNARILGVENVPQGFVEWAMKRGALQHDAGTRVPG
jgi:hypothetical protein